ncbi:hemerythrin domain-containing protein [Cupriavidus alkaliphilus]|uniref:Hemerythrin-like domain-containing protein n=1 Tax=Cupriavidus alkaliphilus TaxID=942866 RepID=A0A7W4VBD6_9BURK|nr:hemerythrin domain-containing protein [Cupriavidus alkaliphilus]MBB3007973.1 hemerythrin-like domain-containing protein [Cupriavidus alkaliphilus]SCB34770.1 Hemerythrin-like domain-containing protein [Cupriavidus alkaliphilus]
MATPLVTSLSTSPATTLPTPSPTPLAAWHTDHIHFASLLDLLEKQVSTFHQGEQPDYGLMTTIIQYMRNYGDCVHHPREDVAYALLVERDPGTQIIISRLLQEHRVIATVGAELLDRLREVQSEVVISRSALEAAAAMYLVYYRNHLSTEEKQVMPRAARFLTDADWAEVAATEPASADPLFGANVKKRFATLRKQIDSEAKASMH